MDVSTKRILRRRHSDVSHGDAVSTQQNQNIPLSINERSSKRCCTRQRRTSLSTYLPSSTDRNERRMTMYEWRQPDTIEAVTFIEDFSSITAFKPRRSKRFSLDCSFSVPTDESEAVTSLGKVNIIKKRDRSRDIPSEIVSSEAIDENIDNLTLNSLDLDPDNVAPPTKETVNIRCRKRKSSKKSNLKTPLELPLNYNLNCEIIDLTSDEEPKRRRSLRRSKSLNDLRIVISNTEDRMRQDVGKLSIEKAESVDSVDVMDNLDEIQALYLNTDTSRIKSNLETIFENEIKGMSKRKYKRFINFNDFNNNIRKHRRISKARKFYSSVVNKLF